MVKRTIFTTTCLQCETAFCLEICPTKAIYRDAQTDAVVVDEAACVGCRMCIPACPFGNMHFEDIKGIAAKCNLCNGDPACVKNCMAKALHYGDINDLAEIRRKHMDRKLVVKAIRTAKKTKRRYVQENSPGSGP